MRRRFGGHRQSLGLGPPDQLDRAGRGEVQEVHRRPGQAHQGQIPGDHRLLGGGRDAGHAEPARPLALVHGTPGGQGLVLAVLGQGDAESAGVVEGPAHEGPVLNPGPVVGEQPYAEGGQLGHRGQPHAEAPHGDGPGHQHLGRRLATELEHLSGRARVVDGRLGVGHGHHRRETTEGGRPGARLDGLGLLAPGLAQVGVQVHQPGGHQAPPGVEDRRPRGQRQVGAHLDDGAGLDPDVGPAGTADVDHRAAADHDLIHASPRSARRTRRRPRWRPATRRPRGGGRGRPYGWPPRWPPGGWPR